MKLNPKLLAKVYIVFFGLIHFAHVVLLLSINETTGSVPPYLGLWWHVILFLVYAVFPILAVLTDNHTFYTVVTGVALVGILVEVFRVFTWITDFVLVPLYALAAVLSLILAIENVASRVSAEFLSLKWSQF